MRKIKKNLGRYLGIGLAAALVLTALYLPQGWFALRDQASWGRIQGESLAPLMVAQLNSSYESDIQKRMSAYLEAYAQGDVNCSSKEMDPEEESLWENIRQSEDSRLMEILIINDYVKLFDKTEGDAVIESCTQHVLMRRSDGQILLVANDILLDKGNGWETELLIDGIDGTVYYLSSRERKGLFMSADYGYAEVWNWELWWLLNDAYDTRIASQNTEPPYSVPAAVTNIVVGENGEEALNEASDYYSAGEQEQDSPEAWFSFGDSAGIYCCLLNYGQSRSSFTLEQDILGQNLYQIRLGLPEVIDSIPEMASRISLAGYDQINEEDAEGMRMGEYEE